jgi:hypothetical protein
LIHGRRHKRYQCRTYRHKAILTAGITLEATKLPLTTWFLAFYLWTRPRRASPLDDAYLGGERCGGKPSRGSENKVPIVAAVSIDDEGHPHYVKLATVATFSFAAIADWA